MTIPWLEEERGVTEMEIARLAPDDGTRLRRLLALIAIAEAAQASLKLYDGDAAAVIHEAVEAAERIE
jgi:hypothetical protein